MNSKDEAKERKKDKEDKNQSKKGLFHISWIIWSQCGETVDKGRLIGEETGIKKQKKRLNKF